MAAGGVEPWRLLFRRAVAILDAAEQSLRARIPWSFGGGTALMLRYRHRRSKDIDIFLPDAQFIAGFSPRLNDAARSLTEDHVEQANFVKLSFPEGEVDFIVAPFETDDPIELHDIDGRAVPLERPAEILAKKLRHRAGAFKARDFYDLTVALRRERRELLPLAPLLAEMRPVLLGLAAERRNELREDFAAIDFLGRRPSFDRCLADLARRLSSSKAAGEGRSRQRRRQSRPRRDGVPRPLNRPVKT
jgi:hypothetical protein